VSELGFIMAASHSGSTLLAMLLGSHPQATTIGDTGGTIHRKDPEYQCSCGCRAKECLFWQQVEDQMACRGFELNIADFGTRFEYPENRFINRVLRAEHRGPVMEAARDLVLGLSPGWRRQARTIAKRNAALVETVNEIANSQILIDSSKHPIRAKFLLRISELKVRIIHLVRDGRGVAHTYVHDNGLSVEEAAFEWRVNVQADEQLLARLDPSLWKQVRYEDLCANPRGELQELCVFLGLDPSQVNLDFRSAGLHVFGNKMRLSSEEAVRLDDRWQTDFTPSEISQIERLTKQQLVKYGYL